MTSPDQAERRRRVPAMAPEDRRAALIAATVPLLHEHGLDVTTRQIAKAAGVAEGTVFGVFPDKNSLIVAALMHALDPRPTLDAMAAIDPRDGLRERMTAAATLVNERFAGNAHLMSAARSLMLAAESHPGAAEQMTRSRQSLLDALTGVIEPDAGLLRRSPGAVARLLLLFCGANTFGPFGDPRRFDGGEIVSLLLDGLLVTPAGPESPAIPLIAASHDHTHGGA
ncbi:TetR/AcrR family transcriptional regulator [Actinoplanes sp. NPDC026623]|uniref:TetR/AcrR family transcriptional regulator n=1 Tax=Actinoplanes sp. NPDC026623 TaxID=3155610 RepID=UPI0033F8C6E1